MSLAKLISQGVSLAQKLTASLQAEVGFEGWVGVDEYGKDLYAERINYPALIEYGQKLMIDEPTGREIMATHVVSFLQPLTPLGERLSPISGQAVEGRREPLDPRDKLTLPDGTTGRIAGIQTLINPEIGAGYYHIAILGRTR